MPLLWKLRTFQRRTVSFSDVYKRQYLDNTHKVSGDEFILGLHGRPVLPLGTITVQETRAPEGYEINPQIYVANTTLQGASSVVTTNLPNTDTYYATEQVIRGDLEFLKTDKETGAVMAGIPFRITSETTGESHVIVTDETGQASTELANHSWKTNKNDETCKLSFIISEGNLNRAGRYDKIISIVKD